MRKRKQLKFLLRFLTSYFMLAIMCGISAWAQGSHGRLVKDIGSGTADGININYCRMVSNGRYVFFKANDGVHGDQVWRSDGTSSGTMMLTATAQLAGNLSDYNGRFAPFYEIVADSQGRVYFQHTDPTHGTELWVSDGTTEGTHMVVDLNPGPPAGVVNGHLGVLGGKVLFVGSRPPYYGVWASDGTASGTLLLRDHQNGHSDITLLSPPNLNGELRYMVQGASVVTTYTTRYNGVEVWQTDGTSSGTVRSDAFLDSQLSVFIEPRVAFLGASLYFIKYGGCSAPWWHDAGASSTLVMYWSGLQEDCTPPLRFKNQVYVAAYGIDYSDGVKVYHDDGSSSHSERWGGSSWFRVPVPNRWSSPQALALLDAGDRMLLWTDTGLWSLDGTAAGSMQLKALAMTPNPSLWASWRFYHYDADYGRSRVAWATFLPGCGRWVFPAAAAGTDDTELWWTDGTASGTTRLADLNPLGSSYPWNFTVLGDKLFLSATDGMHGRELWVVPLVPEANPVRSWLLFQ